MINGDGATAVLLRVVPPAIRERVARVVAEEREARAPISPARGARVPKGGVVVAA